MWTVLVFFLTLSIHDWITQMKIHFLTAFCIAFVLASAVALAANDAPITTIPRPQKIEALSVAQRNTLPDSTSVVLPDGRTATLATLRQQHASRLTRFKSATQLGSNIAALLNAAQFAGMTLVQGKTASGMAADYDAFCRSVKASGCLFIPGPAELIYDPVSYAIPVLRDVDFLLNDPSACTSEGGIPEPGGGSACDYLYPTQYRGNFQPGPPAPGQQIGSGIKSQKACASPQTFSIDPHGVLALQAGGVSETGVAEQTTVLQTCVVWVYIPSSK
jgi:hypothetical protein